MKFIFIKIMVILLIFTKQNMKIKIVEIGKTQQKEWQAFIDEYLSRAKKYRGVELITLQPKIRRTESNEIQSGESTGTFGDHDRNDKSHGL